VDVLVDVSVKDGVGVIVGVGELVSVLDGVLDGEREGVSDDEEDGVPVGVRVGEGVEELVGDGVGDGVTELVGVAAGELTGDGEGVAVEVGDGVREAEGVGVGVRDGVDGALSEVDTETDNVSEALIDCELLCAEEGDTATDRLPSDALATELRDATCVLDAAPLADAHEDEDNDADMDAQLLGASDADGVDERAVCVDVMDGDTGEDAVALAGGLKEPGERVLVALALAVLVDKLDVVLEPVELDVAVMLRDMVELEDDVGTALEELVDVMDEVEVPLVVKVVDGAPLAVVF